MTTTSTLACTCLSASWLLDMVYCGMFSIMIPVAWFTNSQQQSQAERLEKLNCLR